MINKGPWVGGCSWGLLFLAWPLSLASPLLHLPVLSHPEPEKGTLRWGVGFRYQEGALTILESPSEDCRALQQKGLKADGGGIFHSSWHSYSPWSAVTAFSAEDGEKWGEASFPCYPLNSVAEE